MARPVLRRIIITIQIDEIATHTSTARILEATTCFNIFLAEVNLEESPVLTKIGLRVLKRSIAQQELYSHLQTPEASYLRFGRFLA
jgi:hypothetical protein